MSETEVRTTCPYCGVGCGIIARRAQDGSITIKGDPEHPANFGRLCSKGSALGETLSLDDRLLYPRVDGARVTWNAALDHVARQFEAAITEHGPDSVAFYGSGQMLTEDYYVANKLMKGFVGTANIDTNSRLCMASTVAGHRRAFGADTVPGTYEDLELADLVVLVGSNLAWCHPVLFQRLQAARERRAIRVVVVDPRRTATCDGADLHLAITPGSRRRPVQRTADEPRRGRCPRQDLRRRTHDGRSRDAGCRAWPEFHGYRAADRPFARATPRVLRSLHAHRAGRHRLQPGRQPVGRRHRQGQRHPQLPSGHGSHRQAGHGTVLGDRPAERHAHSLTLRACNASAPSHARRECGRRFTPSRRPARGRVAGLDAPFALGSRKTTCHVESVAEPDEGQGRGEARGDAHDDVDRRIVNVQEVRQAGGRPRRRTYGPRRSPANAGPEARGSP